MAGWGYGLIVMVIIIAGLIVIFDRLRVKRTMKQLDDMLELAINGEFTEEIYDETMLSAVEAKLARYLAASAVSARNLQEEKDKIKTLIADISHQTKTPIANLLLYAQLLAEQELPSESRDCVISLEMQAEELQFLIESLIKTSRLETGILALHPTVSPLYPMLKAAVEQAVPKAQEKGIDLTLEPTDLTAEFDAKWTAEAVYNLVDNGVKYTPEGGTVTVRAKAYELFCRIDVIDNGLGISEAEQGMIFKRFYRSPAVAEQAGVGIGLYLVRQIAVGQGGYVKVESRQGEGSTFSLFTEKMKSVKTVRFQTEYGQILLL